MKNAIARRGFLALAATPALLGALQASDAAAQPQSAAANADLDRVLDRLVARVRARGDNALDILLLSQGGQNGAYGAGFLRGWRANASAPMPRFDVVTGISTGAMLAPFALIGTDAALETIAELYRNPADIMPSADPLAIFRPTGGIVSRARIERTIARVLDETLAQQLRAAFADNRDIFVGTTNLDRGTGAIWSVANELASSPEGLARVHQIMLATGAIPGIFAPVELNGETHTDGGVTASLLLGLDLPDFERLAEKLRRAGVARPVRLRVFAIVNFWVHPPAYDVNGRSVRDVRDRANRLMFSHAQQFTLTRFWDMSRAVTAGVPGLTMEMRYTAIPRAFSSAPGAERLFDEAFMQRLQETGYERARGRSPWDEFPLSPYRG